MNATSARAARLPLWLALGCAILTLAGTALATRNGQPLTGDTFGLDLVIVGTVYAGVGGLLAVRSPGNRVGWILLIAACLWSLDWLATQYAVYGAITEPGSLPVVGFATWISTWLWIPGNALLFFGLPLLFPDGHLPSRRWRPVAVVGIGLVVIAIMGQSIVVWPIRDDVTPLLPGFDPSAEPSLPGLMATVGSVGQFLLMPVLAVASLASRYRAADVVTRQQLRWFVVTTAIGVSLVILDQLLSLAIPHAGGVIGSVGLVILPIGIGVAVLRYRLYDIDRIISRTIGWAMVTGVIVLVFAGVVVTLEAVLADVTQGQTLAVAASTLAAFAVFQPLRRRVQRAVDRRFDRARYDGERMAQLFADRLRDEVDIATLTGDLAATTRAALAPARLAVWLREAGR